MNASANKTTATNTILQQAQTSFFKKAGEDGFFKPAVSAPIVQAKLSVSPPDDPMEKEADKMADKVMRMPDASIQRKCSACEEEKKEELQRKPVNDFIQKKENDSSTVSEDVSNSIRSTQGMGNTMQADTKSFMESRMGADFSNVKIHTGGNAVQLSSQLNARAFTTGNDIYFNEGEYSPGSDDGKRLIAHELTHTIQQGGSAPPAINPSAKSQTIQRQTTPPGAPVPAPAPGATPPTPAPAPSATGTPAPTPATTTPASPTVTPPAATTPTIAPASPTTQPTTEPAALTPAEVNSRRAALVAKLGDIAWIANAFSSLDTDAHPIHKMNMMAMLTQRVMGHLMPLITNMGARVRSASTEAEFSTLTSDIDEYKIIHGVDLTTELSAVIDFFRLIEQLYVIGFLNGTPITKDPANPNHSAQHGLLEYQRGLVGTVNYITRVNYTWTRTTGAVTAGIADWTDAEKTAFRTSFQQQLNDVWDSRHAAAFTPFRVSEPEDYLLKSSPQKWSDITAHMHGEVRDAAATSTPDFVITVTKRDTATETGLRAGVNTGTGQFYADNAQAGYDSTTGAETGGQHTLAHEWAHMSGQPDEYAENSAGQSASWVAGGSTGTTANSLGSDQWTACQTELNRRAADATLTAAQRAQATSDLADLTNHATDMDSTTPGFQAGIFGTAHRADNTLPLPDGCFAVRGQWTGPGSMRLRPGASSERGGTHISQSAADAARLTDRGNQVHAYHREGILQELNSALETQTTPRVQFDHNFRDMTVAENLETIEGRLNNISHDIQALLDAHAAGTHAPATSVPEGERPE